MFHHALASKQAIKHGFRAFRLICIRGGHTLLTRAGLKKNTHTLKKKKTVHYKPLVILIRIELI
jgi:hypothetical protein